jgi:hypothetical protein
MSIHKKHMRSDDNTVVSSMAGKKVLAYDVVSVRSARSGDYAPLIVPLPRSIADAMKVKKGNRLRIYTDGDRIYLDRFEEPQI